MLPKENKIEEADNYAGPTSTKALKMNRCHYKCLIIVTQIGCAGVGR